MTAAADIHAALLPWIANAYTGALGFTANE